jgi:hypothetical protein
MPRPLHGGGIKSRYLTNIFIFVMGGLSSALLISWEDFACPVIFTGGLLSALSFHGRAYVWLDIFGWESFCPEGLLSVFRKKS